MSRDLPSYVSASFAPVSRSRHAPGPLWLAGQLNAMSQLPSYSAAQGLHGRQGALNRAKRLLATRRAFEEILLIT